LKKADSLDDTTPVLTALACAYAAAGQTADARNTLRTLEQRYVPPFLLASVYLRLGDRETALALLEKAYSEHDWALLWINVTPRFDPLRSEPRFQAIVSRMKFPPRKQ
jgi:tetratricopeptide (TPR) repeat protein